MLGLENPSRVSAERVSRFASPLRSSVTSCACTSSVRPSMHKTEDRVLTVVCIARVEWVCDQTDPWNLSIEVIPKGLCTPPRRTRVDAPHLSSAAAAGSAGGRRGGGGGGAAAAAMLSCDHCHRLVEIRGGMVRTSRRPEEDSSPIRGGVEREDAVPERTVRLARKATTV